MGPSPSPVGTDFPQVDGVRTRLHGRTLSGTPESDLVWGGPSAQLVTRSARSKMFCVKLKETHRKKRVGVFPKQKREN